MARGPAPAMSALERELTVRETDVLKLAARGKSNKEIAADLSLCIPTVKSHLVSILTKIGAASRTEAILEALRRGWVNLDDVGHESHAPEPGVLQLSA